MQHPIMEFFSILQLHSPTWVKYFLQYSILKYPSSQTSAPQKSINSNSNTRSIRYSLNTLWTGYLLISITQGLVILSLLP
jgi:hypothetical protein